MRLLILLIASLIAMMGGANALAQETATDQSAGNPLADLGYPELHVKATAAGLETPDTIQAGQVLLTVENKRDMPTIVAPVKLAEGDSIDDILTALKSGGEGNDVLLPFRDATWAGGEPAIPGETTAGMVVNLTPGTWYILDASDMQATPPALTVTGDATADPGEVVGTSVSIDMTDFQFVLPERVEAGTQIWQFTNAGEQLHDVHVLQVPDGTTPDDVLQALTRPEGTEPEPGDLVVNENMVPAFGFGVMSSGQTMWTDVSIEAGTYVIVTWMTEEESGVPQFMLGMLSVFTVVEPGQNALPPASPEPAG